MTEFVVGDTVRVEMPRGYNKRGVLGVSVMYTTWPEARFEGAIGRVSEINPVGSQMVHQYLIDFRTHDNSRVGIPWQAHWFREEWLAPQEQRAEVEVAAGSRQPSPPPGAESDAGAAVNLSENDPSRAVTDHLRLPKDQA